MRRVIRLSPLAAMLCVLLASCAGSPGPPGGGTTSTTSPGTPAATATPQSGGRICGWAASPPVTWAHVVWIWMENRDYRHVVGSPEAPYENHTLMAGCGLATNYHNVTHPSLPNYLAATSGAPQVHIDCPPSVCATDAPSLFAQLSAAGKSWRSYEESMPANCFAPDAGNYAARHNPPVYYIPIAADCARWDVPMGSASGGNLFRDLRAGSLPAFSFITPNLCNDTHNCPIGTGDRWLATWVPKILKSPAYQAGGTVVVITWDEGDSGGTGDCASNTSAPGCHVATIVISPTTRPGTRAGKLFNHYSLLSATERLLGLPATLGAAADSSSADMRSAFNL